MAYLSDFLDLIEKKYCNYPANTGNPIVAVLINAPAKMRKGSNGYLSIMRFSG
tara:strand:+ start:430 stop:588 length:159 start_codon:yes stop_codon:yes gene_type:complete